MAKPTEKDITPGVVASGKDAADYVQDTARGEKGRQASDALNALAASMAGKDTLAKLDKALNAKPDAFEKKTSDFWKPAKEGEEVRGIYLGSVDGPKYKIHAIGTRDAKTGENYAVRINGSTILTKELLRGNAGDAVRIVYKGAGKTDGGNRLQQFEVSWLS